MNGAGLILPAFVPMRLFLFTINWEKIPEQGLSAAADVSVEDLVALTALQDQGVCRFVTPIAASLDAHWVSELLQVSGHVSCDAVLSCSRCLKEFNQHLEGGFDLTFARQLPEISMTEDEEGEGVELTADDLGLVYAPGDVIELHDIFAEQLILALPTKPLCDDSCAGLCARCGQDLNRGDCGCRNNDFNNRFAALKNLKLNKE
ncbi:hypothetical protein B5V00_01450 [Geothermobacter hydrogeniphilus]|uniref:DUF177 domain-containing protein n=1 Tax=Geothermobacter hydrogeniphilus TaxID=1969733 RepID=A0A1X0YEC3_9BACT|nr:hypothetical protein B5V00_01450 [Geothermobacter hydrogeniphilus]